MLAAAFCSSAAAQAATPVGGVRWYIRVSPALDDHLLDNCMLSTSRYKGGRHEPVAWSNFPSFNPATGSWDSANGTLSAASDGRGPHFKSFTAESGQGGHHWSIDDVGVDFGHGRAELSGVIHRAKAGFGAKGRRQVFAVIPHATLTAGLGHRFASPLDDRGPLPNSLIVRVRGKAYVAPAFVAAAGRWRCRRGPFAQYKQNRVRRGELLGTVSAEVAPAEGRGLAGMVDTEGPTFLDSNSNRVAVTVTPTGSATKHGGGIRFPIATSNARIRCDSGFNCLPVGDGLTVAGGFTLGYGGRTATIADLAFTWEDDFVIAAITGTLDGQPLQIAERNGFPTAAFHERLSQALGTDVNGGFEEIKPLFTTTGPL